MSAASERRIQHCSSVIQLSAANFSSRYLLGTSRVEAVWVAGQVSVRLLLIYKAEVALSDWIAGSNQLRAIKD